MLRTVKWELFLAFGKMLTSTTATEEGNPNVISLFKNQHANRKVKEHKHGNLLLLLRVITGSDPKLTKVMLKQTAAPAAPLSPWTPPRPTASCP